MKKFLIFALTIVLAACSAIPDGGIPIQATDLPAATQIAQPVPATPTLVPPMATESATTAPENNWKLPSPPDANQLPTELSAAITYIAPPENCATANDPNETCSTIKGQNTDGDFVLKAGQAIVMTGDNISITQEGEILADQPSYDTEHDLWVVVNSTTQDIKLHMLAPHGSFRGYFAPADGKWNVQKVSHLLNLHLYLFLLPVQTYDRFTPTPVPNCESQFGCEQVNTRGIVFDENGKHAAAYGLYKENQPFWQDLLQLLGQ